MTKKIPATGKDRQEVLEEMKSFHAMDFDWKSGKTWSLAYHYSDEHKEFLKEAYSTFMSENALNPMVFKSLKKMESDVVRMTADMLHGDEHSVGTMTSGGTESILMAVKAAKNRAKAKRPWIRNPELVAPRSAHVAFEKACDYFGVKFVPVALDKDFRVNVKKMRKKINRNTILLVGSAPQYVQGVIDPIGEIGKIAQEKNIPFHVDACIGGFQLPWLEKLGYKLPKWDFRVPGVTSISADCHKFGYAAKGASTITYRSMDYLKHQFFVATDWTGGIYASPSFPGTRPGGAIAAAWAAMNAIGEDGYMKVTKEAMEAKEEFEKAIKEIPELEVVGKPQASLVSFKSTGNLDIYVIADILGEKGWNMDRQQVPPSLHLTITSNHKPVIGKFVEELKESVAYAHEHPELAGEGDAPMYGMMAKMPIRGAVKYSVMKVMEAMYSGSGEIPDLSKLGEGEDADPMFKLMNKYGDKAMGALKKVQEGKEELSHKVKSLLK